MIPCSTQNQKIRRVLYPSWLISFVLSSIAPWTHSLQTTSTHFITSRAPAAATRTSATPSKPSIHPTQTQNSVSVSGRRASLRAWLSSALTAPTTWCDSCGRCRVVPCRRCRLGRYVLRSSFIMEFILILFFRDTSRRSLFPDWRSSWRGGAICGWRWTLFSLQR